MTFNEIKNSLFGYSKTDVCHYITELNTLHDAQRMAAEDKLNEETEKFAKESEALRSEVATLTEKNSEYEEEIAHLKERIAEIESDNKTLSDKYGKLEQEAGDLKARSELISTAILNAEKCAGKLIDDANERANDMITDAKDKVDAETKKLDTAKQYITEVRAAVAAAMRNIDNTLAAAETNIGAKKNAIEANDEQRKEIPMKERVSFFKRA